MSAIYEYEAVYRMSIAVPTGNVSQIKKEPLKKFQGLPRGIFNKSTTNPLVLAKSKRKVTKGSTIDHMGELGAKRKKKSFEELPKNTTPLPWHEKGLSDFSPDFLGPALIINGHHLKPLYLFTE